MDGFLIIRTSEIHWTGQSDNCYTGQDTLTSDVPDKIIIVVAPDILYKQELYTLGV